MNEEVGEEFNGLTVLVVDLIGETVGEFLTFTIGRAVGETNEEPPKVAKLRETKGLAVGLGVELRELLTTGFKRPGAGKVKFCFGDNGNKTDDLVDILLIKRN